MENCIIKNDVNKMKMQKTYKGWIASSMPLSIYLDPGDQVDTSMIDFIRKCYTPVTMTKTMVQMGESLSMDFLSRPTYLTFERVNDIWIFTGEAIKALFLKTYKNWVLSETCLSKFLKPGDQVDTSLIDYVLECLLPVTWTKAVIQMGEAHSVDVLSGKLTYLTFVSNGKNWVYTGIFVKHTIYN